MSLYYVQKFIYNINRDTKLQTGFAANADMILANYDLTDEEACALREADIGLLYVMGVNGQLLMHYAAYRGLAWDDYIQAMKDGLAKYGEVRTGSYATIDGGAGGAV
ncbi:MAG: aromatic ring-opening dioxygenase subunit LigA [Alphaproteobacteria bacterium]|nr:aromatic ring-opening dioxygenase subunit LigA [Alphaproteobacteria bacterium]